MPHVKIDDNTQIYYEISGQGHPLVLIAGYCCDHTAFEPIKAALAQHFTVIGVDNLGSGQTRDKPVALTIESLADAIMALIKQLDLNTPHIAGHSMGGMMTQTLAHKYGNQIGKIATINSQTQVLKAPSLALGAMLQLRQQNAAIDALIDLVLPWLYSFEYLQNPAHIQQQRQLILNTPFPQSVEDQARQFKALIEFNSRNWVNQIKNSTLVIGSQSDIIATAQQSHELAEMIPHATLKLTPGGHVSITEDASQISQLLIEFFQN